MALVGTGTMGSPIGRCLLGTGHDVRAVDRMLDAAVGLMAAGATTAAEAADGADGVSGRRLEPSDLHPVVRASSGATYVALAPMLLRRDVEQVNFRLDIAAKDLALAVGLGEELGVELATTRAASSVYDAAIEAGLGPADFHATLLQLEAGARVEVPELRRRPEGETSRSGRCRPTGTSRSSPTRSASTSAGTRTPTSASVGARTSASGPAWPGWRSG